MFNGPQVEDDRVAAVAVDRWAVENIMLDRITRPADPFEGRGARRTRLRVRIEGAVALALAIIACGLAAALWMRTLAPFVGPFALG